jgi:hypothetical protein
VSDEQARVTFRLVKGFLEPWKHTRMLRDGPQIRRPGHPHRGRWAVRHIKASLEVNLGS